MKRVFILGLITTFIATSFGCQFVRESFRDYYTLDDDKVYYYVEKPWRHRHSIYVGEGNGGKIIAPPAGAHTGFHSKEGNIIDGVEEEEE